VVKEMTMSRLALVALAFSLWLGGCGTVLGQRKAPVQLTSFPAGAGEGPPVRFAGGLLGQWAVWTRRAAELLARVQQARRTGTGVLDLLAEGAQLTEANAAIFDARHGFAGCIAGIHEVLRAQGLLAGRWCLDPNEDLSPGQLEEIQRVRAAYPRLADDAFVAQNRDRWLA